MKVSGVVVGVAGVDVILDIMGGSYLPRNIKALAMDGRLFHIATQGGMTGELDINSVIYRRLTVTGSFRYHCEPCDMGTLTALTALCDDMSADSNHQPLHYLLNNDTSFSMANCASVK